MKEEIMTLMMDQTNKLTTLMMDQANISKSSPSQKDTTTPPDSTTTVQTNRKAPTLEGEISEIIGGMWTIYTSKFKLKKGSNKMENKTEEQFILLKQ